MVKLWLLAGLVAACLQAAYSVGQKLVADDYHPLTIMFCSTTVGLVLYTPIAVYHRANLAAAASPKLAGAALLSGVTNALIYYLTVRAMTVEDVSVVAPLKRLYRIFVGLLEPVLLGIAFSINLFAGAVGGAVGAYLIVSSGDDPLSPFRNISSSGVQFALLAALVSAGAVLIDRFVLSTIEISPFAYAFLMYAVAATATAVALRILGVGLPDRADYADPRMLALGVTLGSMTIMLYVTLSMATGTQVSTVLLLSSPLAVIVGGGFLGEDDTLQNVVGSIVILAAIALVT